MSERSYNPLWGNPYFIRAMWLSNQLRMAERREKVANARAKKAEEKRDIAEAALALALEALDLGRTALNRDTDQGGRRGEG